MEFKDIQRHIDRMVQEAYNTGLVKGMRSAADYVELGCNENTIRDHAQRIANNLIPKSAKKISI